MVVSDSAESGRKPLEDIVLEEVSEDVQEHVWLISDSL